MMYADTEQELSFKLDGTKKPKQIVQICKFRSVGRKIVGIYSLDGDTLKICNLENEKAAIPDDFTAAEGSRRVTFVLQRVRSAGDAIAASPVRADVNPKPTQRQADSPKMAKPIDGGGQGVLIGLYDQLQTGCLNLKKANREIYAKDVTEGRIIRPVIVHRDDRGQYELIEMAETGTLEIDSAKGNLVIVLSNVDIITRNGDRAFITESRRPIPLALIDGVR